MRHPGKQWIASSASAISFMAGVAMLVVAWQIQPVHVMADGPPPDCFNEGQSVCTEVQECCNGVCYNPQEYVCTCEGTLEPIQFETE